MIIKYFPDTDTLFVEFSERAVSETVDFNEETLIDLDEAGNVVALTIEHARRKVDLTDFSFQQVVALETGD